VTENSIGVSLEYLSDKPPVAKNKKPLIYSIAIGKDIGNFIGHSYALLYAVFIQSTPFLLSIITSIRNLIQLAVQSPFGRLSDKFGRKPFLVLGLFVTALMCAVYPLSIDYTQQYSIIFGIGAVGFFLAGVLTLFMKETAPNTMENYPSSNDFNLKRGLVNTLKPLQENPNFRRFVLVCALMDFSMSAGWPIFIFVRERYASPTEYSLMWAAFMIFQVCSLMIGGYLIDKRGKRIGFWGRRVMFLIPLVLYFSRNWIELTLGNIIGGFGYGLYFVTINAYIIDSAPEESKGHYVGAYQLIMGVVTFIGSISMGIVTEILIGFVGKWSAIYTMLLAVAVLRFIGGMAFFTVDEPMKPNPLISKQDLSF